MEKVMKLEQLTSNEEMRHVPPLEVLLRRVDDMLRRGIDEALASARSADQDTIRDVDVQLKRASLCLARVAELARHHRGVTAAHPEPRPIIEALEGAVSSLRNADKNLRRRTPFHHFERSRGEMLYGSLLSAEQCVAKAIQRLSVADGEIHYRLSMRNPLTRAVQMPDRIAD